MYFFKTDVMTRSHTHTTQISSRAANSHTLTVRHLNLVRQML